MGFSRPEHWWHSGGRGRLTCSWIVPVLLAIGTSLLINTGPAMALTLTSSAFEPGGAISSKYTCEGDNVLPLLALPARRRGLRPLCSSSTILMPPTRPQSVWVHWLVYNLPPDTRAWPRMQAARACLAARRQG